MGWIKERVENLCNKYGTRNPIELATCLNIILIKWDLHEEIKGFYQYEKRNKFIFYSSSLNDEEMLMVIAHELGHVILHRYTNTPFMKKYTFQSVNRIETEANTFAAELLISDESLRECRNYTIEQIAALHKVPVELVKLKCKGLF